MTCGFGGQPMLSFCDEHYVWHMAEAHQHVTDNPPRSAIPSDDEIRRRILTCGISLHALSKRCGVSVATLSRFTRGKGMALETYRKLDAALRIDGGP